MQAQTVHVSTTKRTASATALVTTVRDHVYIGDASLADTCSLQTPLARMQVQSGCTGSAGLCKPVSMHRERAGV